MSTVKRLPLRKIAENELSKHFADMPPAVRDELATSMVRQWLTCDGHAGLVTPDRQLWFRMVAEGGRIEVGFGCGEGNWGRILAQQWHVAEEEIPGLLHRLNVSQTAVCRTTDGLTVRLRIEPRERTVRCEEVAEDEAEGPEV